MAAPALPADVQRLREQLLKDQAPSARSRTQVFETSAFISKHGRPYSSRRIPIDTLDEMRTDAVLRFAQLVALVSIFAAKWHIECTNARKAQFIDRALRRVIGRFIVQFFESWNFGFQALVKEFGLMDPGWEFLDKDAEGGPKMAKVWDGSPYPALVWEPFVPLSPRVVAPVWTSAGDFNGIALATSGPGAYALPTVPFAADDILDIPADVNSRFNDNDETRKKIDVTHALWVTNERDGRWGSVWGRSRLSYAFKYWWSYELALGILNRSIEKKGDPTIIVAFPSGSSSIGGKEVPNQQIAFDIGERARSGSVLAVPSEVWGDDMATANQAPKWKIDTLKLEADFQALQRVLEYFDTMKIRAMMVSELAIAEGSGGTSSRNVAATTGERTAEAQIFTQQEWDEIINRYLIPQLADANFPELKDVPARKVTQAFGENEAALSADLIRSMANSSANSLPVDWKKELEKFQISSLEGEELERFEQRMIAQAETSQPPKTEAQPNGAAGVTETGFYYNAREHIQLEDEALLAALPKSKHYTDRAVLAQTRLVRRLWRQQLAEQYEDFATYIGKSDVNLADRPAKVEAAAERLVAGWKFAGKGYAKAIKAVALALQKILARAGILELSSSRMSKDAFDPESKDLAQWVREHAAEMVRSVEQTTRDQLRTFLASELQAGRDAQKISENLRAHFAEFPDWRADLIAREETKRFYNAGTLFAAESSGSTQVQALDAQLGPTDEECERRHGRIFPIADAWAESAKEHIRGTLGWRIVPPASTELSFTRLPAADMGGTAARIDQEERAIFLAEGIDPATEGRFLERAVDWLIAAT